MQSESGISGSQAQEASWSPFIRENIKTILIVSVALAALALIALSAVSYSTDFLHMSGKYYLLIPGSIIGGIGLLGTLAFLYPKEVKERSFPEAEKAASLQSMDPEYSAAEQEPAVDKHESFTDLLKVKESESKFSEPKKIKIVKKRAKEASIAEPAVAEPGVFTFTVKGLVYNTKNSDQVPK